ncbi:MAG: histidine--tRNA ligase, partial [Pyrinomonadaceae bacterium]|nr:histidine--tRNA ligase [Pyrinomonadaceae bacterium]
ENELSDLALRYDLTVPLARVIANNRNELPRFFKRYQIQPVWRADRPARGRYREFYQCDVDAIGSGSMLAEAELCSAICDIFDELGFEDYAIRVNDRRLLFAVIDASGIDEDLANRAVVVLDKLDKIGFEKVADELKAIGVSGEAAGALIGLLKKIEGKSNSDVIRDVSSFTSGNETADESIRDLESILSLAKSDKMAIDVSLARGLSYYTGAIFEVILTGDDFSGSVTGGGRYDGLIGMFGKEKIPAVGLSIGLERILLVMDEREMFPEKLTDSPADVMVALWNEDTIPHALQLAGKLRESGLRVLVYPQPDKLGKQFKYADQVAVKYVCILGESEIEESSVSIKNLATGEQQSVPLGEAVAFLVQ